MTALWFLIVVTFAYFSGVKDGRAKQRFEWRHRR